MKKKIIQYAFLNAFATTVYIILVVLLLDGASKMPALSMKTSILAPMLMLSLLVFSASITGSLVFVRPILWYLDGKKKEAIHLLAYTLGFFFLITCFAFIFLLMS